MPLGVGCRARVGNAGGARQEKWAGRTGGGGGVIKGGGEGKGYTEGRVP